MQILCLLIIILFSLPFSSSSSTHEPFIHCLLNHSLPSHPICPSLYTPNNPSFSSILQSHIRNLRFNSSSTPKPFLIVTPSHVSHIQVAILCARKHSLHMITRSGGHDYEGASYVSHDHHLRPFFILDMFNLRAIDIDIESHTAWVQTEATLGELYYGIAEKSGIHGFPGGTCPTVGVGGFISGGGYGNLIRKYGLSVDNVIDAEIVDVNGRLLNRKSMGEDLFWAITGGRGASFGVVLSYRIKLVSVPDRITVFQVGKTLEEDATNIVHQWQHAAPSITKDLYFRAILEVVKGNTQNNETEKTIKCSFQGLFLGDSKTLVSVLNEDFPKLGLKQSDCIETSWIRSVLFWAPSNDITKTPHEVLLNRIGTPESQIHLKRKSDFVKKPISKKGLEEIWKKMIELEHISLLFHPYGGKMDEVSAPAKPSPHRAGNLWKIQYKADWKKAGKEVEDQYLNLTREIHRFMTPFVSSNPRQAFYNYKDHDLGNNTKVYGEMYFGMKNFNRLVQIKTKVDPGNFFRNEQSIPTLPIIPENNYHHESVLDMLNFIILANVLYIWIWGKVGCSCRKPMMEGKF